MYVFKYFRGILFENGKRYAKSETTIQKALEERIPNHILHFKFERKTSVSQSNLEYMYTMTQNDRKCQNASKCFLRNGTESNDTSSYFLLDHSNAYGLSWGNSLSRTSLPQRILSGEGGGMNFQLFPLLGPPCILTGPNWHMHNLAMGPPGLQYKTIIGSLWYLATEEMG